MHKLFKRSHEYLYTTIKTQFENPKKFTPISYLHSFSKTRYYNSKLDFVFDEIEELQKSKPLDQITLSSSELDELPNSVKGNLNHQSTVQISHPWPEWVDLMECLLKRGYFDDGDEIPFANSELGSKEVNRIRTSCLNFARDQYSLMRHFSRKDIRVIAGCGCPGIDRKVVNSGKRLRAHVGIDEGNVCSSCNLRGNCERAYVKAREEEGGQTVDVMRILLTYGFHPITGSVENKPCLNKVVKESVRRLLNEMVEFSSKEFDSDIQNATKMNAVAKDHLSSVEKEKGAIKVPVKPGDWHCPKCQFLNFARNIRCLRCDSLFEERLSKLRADQDHLPLKKGDWICQKCNFLNFAKNTRCLQCKEKPPKRHLNPGEWECESCNYVNFRRNMVCLKCDHRRPKASKASYASAQSKHDTGRQPNAGGVSGNNETNDQKYLGQRNRGRDTWRFVEGESEDHNSSDSLNEDSRFVDFPIEGGNSELSRNPQKRERWKLEMLERSRRATMTKCDEESNSATGERRKQLLESTGDEDRADWFQH